MRKSCPPPPEKATYRYLQKVYRLARKLSPEQRKALTRQARKIHKNTKYGQMPFRAIIDLTALSHVGARMKWKYAQALRYANANGIKGAALIDFLQEAGGLNACVQKSGKLKSW